MKVVILLTLLVALTVSEKWAVLVAGSNTYSNYRHQADVFHSYQSLINNGFDPEKIIVMAYDDIANSTSNPFKGKVFNKPSYSNAGVDVYAGVKIDYSKGDVTPQNFINVLLGDKQAAKGKKVLEAGPSDNIFIFFSDHGAVGLIAFPSTYMYADQLLQTFQKMKGKYGKIVFYLQTCESGSMFQKLPNNTGIYAVSAASPSESSWGTYCSPDDVVSGRHVGSCLGDLFSVNFIEDLDKGNYDSQTLGEQYQVVKKLTTLSKVMQWGDLSFQSDKVGDYVSGSTPRSYNLRLANFIGNFGVKKVESAKMNSRTLKLQSLSAIYARDQSPAVFKEMVEEIVSMKKYDAVFTQLSEKLTLDGEFNQKEIKFECLRPAVELYESRCGKFSDYGLMYVRTLAEACDEYDLQTISSTLRC